MTFSVIRNLSLTNKNFSKPSKKEDERHKLGLQAEGPDFTIEGKPFKIYSGEMHYFRIHQEYWEHRLGQLAASGLNTGLSF